MKKIIGLLSLLLPAILFAQQHTLISPDGRYSFVFEQKAGNMKYSICYDGEPVVLESKMGVQVENELFENALAVPNDTCQDWCSNFRLLKVERSNNDNIWSPIYGERMEVRDFYNAMTMLFSKSGEIIDEGKAYERTRTYFLNIEIRAYNEGIAFRYVFPETTNGMFLHITDEKTEFHMPVGSMAYHEKWAQGPYNLLPLKNWTAESERPLTIIHPKGLIVAIGEASLHDFVRTKIALKEDNVLKTSMYGSADVITEYKMPWRVVRIAESAADLANGNDIMLNLNEPCKIKNTEWIRPGKVFRCNLNQKAALEGIDFAVERGLQYIELDAGWYGKEFLKASDATTIAEDKDLDLKAICDYGKTRNIGVIVYVNQRALLQQLDQILPLYKEWGIAGLKFGFVQVGNQYWTEWLHEAVRKCAEYKMLVDIHDEYRPTGYSRTYPNLMTQEGIRGNEEMPDAQHNVTLPFTRYLAGAGDYTLCYFNNRVKNTHAHQLAMAVVYYSPLQFMYWYDRPELYHGEAELNFWKDVPSVWKDTRFLLGEIGEYVATARQSAENKWFLGIMNGFTERTISIPTDFLEAGKKYTAIIYEDMTGTDIKKLPKESNLLRTKVKITRKTIKGGKPLEFHLLSSGGAAVKFE